MNLVINARDAMPAGGRLSITTRNVDLSESYAAGHVGARAGPHVMIAISDTGTGMDSQTLSHIFEPFFTTKPVGKGTGLGLATVYGIVTQAGGHITVRSRVGHGTTFKVHLPAVEEDAHLAGDLPVAQDGRGEETILFCEDEDLVRRLGCRILESAGYVVLDAVDGRQALEVARQHEGPIDLLVTDLIMPEMNGRDLAKALKAQRPDLQVLFISGYASDLLGPPHKCEEAIEFLAKPFRPPDLLGRVRQILEAAKNKPR
jgi:CheY-like chemotaxis protein